MFTLRGWMLVLMGTVISAGVPGAMAFRSFPDELLVWVGQGAIIGFAGTVILVRALVQFVPPERKALFVR